MNNGKMTKVLSLVMVLAMLLGVCAPTVMAAENENDDAWTKLEGEYAEGEAAVEEFIDAVEELVDIIEANYGEAIDYVFKNAQNDGVFAAIAAAADAAYDALGAVTAWAEGTPYAESVEDAVEAAKAALATVEDFENYDELVASAKALANVADEIAAVLAVAAAEAEAYAKEYVDPYVVKITDEIVKYSEIAAEEIAELKAKAEVRIADLEARYETAPEEVKAELRAEIELAKAELEEAIALVKAECDKAIEFVIAEYSDDIAAALGVAGGAVKFALDEYSDDVLAVLDIAAAMAAQVYEDANIDEFLAEAYEELDKLYKALADCAEDSKQIILDEIDRIKAEIEETIKDTNEKIEEKIEEINKAIEDKLAELYNQVVAQLTALYNKVVEILNVAANIYDALVEIVENVKYIITSIDAYIDALLAIDYKAFVEAAFDLFNEYAPAVAENVVEWLIANREAVIDLLIASGNKIVEFFEQNSEDVLAFVGYVAEKYGAEASAIVEEILNNALTFDYTVSGESMILAIGGNYAVEYEEHYANVLADLLKINGQTGVIATEGLRISDLLAILDADYDNDAYGDALLAELDVEALRELYVESIKASDLITVEFGVEDFTGFVINQLLGKAIADHGETLQALVDSLEMGVVLSELEAYELEWNRFGTLADVVDIDAALAEIKAQLIANGLPEYYEVELEGETIVIAVADYATYAIECFAYALTNYVYNYGAAIEAINAINPNAQIAVLGAINALQGISFEIEGTVINVGEYADYIVDALDAQTFIYALALPNTTYIPVQDAENYVAGAYGEVTYMDLIFVDFELVGEEDLAVVVKVNPEVLTPSAAGHAYIAEQIYAAMNVTCGHAYDWCLDETCNICGELRVAPGHVYSSPCDADCDVCGAIRSGVGHKYDNCYDAICNICGEERVITGHVFNNRCDAICNVCGFEREVEGHKYDNVCDEFCNTCGSKRETGGHKYTNACDVDCDICGTTRVPAAHKYDDCVDADCNVCGKTRTVPGHTFGAWEIVKEATTTEAGEQKHTCKVCGATETEEIAKLAPPPVEIVKPKPDPKPDPQPGPSVGAIVGIVVGSVAVAAVAGFAVFWFAVKKSNFAALGAAIKGICGKIAGLFKKG